MTKHTEHSPSAIKAAQTMWSWNGPSIDTFFNAYENWAGDMARMQDESLRFLRRRMSRNLENATSLATCKSPADALELQMRFAGDAISDYMSEGQKMVSLFGRAAAQGVAETKATPQS